MVNSSNEGVKVSVKKPSRSAAGHIFGPVDTMSWPSPH